MRTITVYHEKDFRRWLEKYHATQEKVAVVLHKRHTGKKAPNPHQLMREAICFGWIDTTVKRLDTERYMIRYSRRTNHSKWSDNTLRYARELIKEGKMAPAGLHFYKLGRAKPTHDAGIPKNPDMPPDLQVALAKSKKLAVRFAAFPPSAKRMLYRWILHAKLPATRQARIQKVLQAARTGEKDVI